MKANWLILSLNRSHGVSIVYDAVERSGYTVKCLPFVPTDRDSIYPEGSCVVANGTANALAELVKARNWVPIGWCGAEVFSCRNYYGHWGSKILQQTYVMLPLGEVSRKKRWLFDNLAESRKLFVRPDSHDKIFDGTVIEFDQFDAWLGQLASDGISQNTLCIVARPVRVESEWRLVIRHHNVLTGSSYRLGGRIIKTEKPPPDVIQFAESIAADPFPGLPNLYVMDICLTDGSLAVMEVGSVNSSGFYGCDLVLVVAAMSEEAELQWQMKNR